MGSNDAVSMRAPGGRIFRVIDVVRSFALLAVLAVAACSGQGRVALPFEEELITEPLGEVQVTGFSVEPSVPAATIAPDLSNLVQSDRLGELSPHQRDVLVENGFVVLPSQKRHMYELYLSNEEPYVTADALFHVWHVLLADTLHRYERMVMLPAVIEMASAATRSLIELRSEVPGAIRPDVDMALRYWTNVWRLADPEYRPTVELVDALGIVVGADSSTPPKGDRFSRGFDPAILTPQSGYSGDDDLERYFRAVKYLSVARVPVTSPSHARQAMLVSLAVWNDPQARSAWLRLERVASLLVGAGEDTGPCELLRLCRRIYGRSINPRELASDAKATRLLRALEALPRPEIDDLVFDVSTDTEPPPTVRVLPPGVTLRAMAFDAIGDTMRPPSGRYIAGLLGSLPFDEPGDAVLLQPVRDRLERVLVTPAEPHDLNTSALAVLAALSQMQGEGYPAYARSEAWRTRIANTQLGGWSEVEHDTFLYAKMVYNLWSMLLGTAAEPFAGSVEPAPEFFARLADVVHRTRTAFEELGAFDAIAAEQAEPDSGIVDIPPTREHFLTLEELLGDLIGMAEAVLADRPFDHRQVEVLRSIGDTLEELSLDRQSLASPPMSTIACVGRGPMDLFAGVGRPLEIVIAVPSGGRFHLARGAIFSYYEFLEQSGVVITDRKWKEMASRPLREQVKRPWLEGHGLGLDDARSNR